jgi:hypothetical protein
MTRPTAINAGDDDFVRLLGFLARVGSVAAAIILLRRFFLR